ncbi:MAG: hypothetical protein H7844_09315 [Nitrospirae bacterium YQR-1]
MEQISAGDFLNKAIAIPQCCKVINGIMERYDVHLGVNSVVVVINCPDEQCTTVIDNIKHGMRKFYPEKFDDDTLIKVEKFYNMRLFGGLFLPKIKTYESLLPAAHHVPVKKDGKLMILNLSHIGYDNNTKEFGLFVRYGHDSATASCGAISSCYDIIVKGSKMPSDTDLRALSKYIKQTVSLHNIQQQPSGYDLLEVTLKAYSGQAPWVKQQLTKLAKKDNLSIIYIGGIEIDTNKEHDIDTHDKIVLIDKFIVGQNGNITDIS